MKAFLIRTLVTLAIASPAVNAVESEDPLVIFNTDFAIPEMQVGNGSGTPVCIDQPSGLFVAGCDGAEGPQGIPGNLALAGKQCPSGEFISGFDNEGNIICTKVVAQCGNGIIESGEVCDDGNNVDGDGCSFNCLSSEVCPDGIINQVTGEECDDGNSDNHDACLNTCELAACGDAVIRIGLEQCDDGNLDETDACLSNCTSASCGDGFTQVGVEECDDGNFINGDGCSDTCTSESISECTGQLAGTPCGDAPMECTNQDTCDGAGSCVANGYKSAGTSCGDPSSTACTNPDTCDGAGSCYSNHVPPGISCGDPSSTQCTNPDTCDGAGSCYSNHVPLGTLCEGGFCGETGICEADG